MKEYDLNLLLDQWIHRPIPDSCMEIDQLLSNLPIWSSFINTSPKPEQKRALKLINEKAISPNTEEILFLADLYCGKYHRIRRDGDFTSFQPKKAKEYYLQYHALTNDEKIKYLLDYFDEYEKQCLRSLRRRQNDDDYEPYRNNSYLSTSRDPDSSEWKK